MIFDDSDSSPSDKPWQKDSAEARFKPTYARVVDLIVQRRQVWVMTRAIIWKHSAGFLMVDLDFLSDVMPSHSV